MTQPGPLTRLDCQGCNLLGCNLRNEQTNPGSDLGAILVKLLLPQHAAENGAPQHLFRAQYRSRSSLVSTQRRTVVVVELQNVQAHHSVPPSSKNSLSGKNRGRDCINRP